MSPKVTWRRVLDSAEDTAEVLEESSMMPPRRGMTITVKQVSSQDSGDNRHGEVLIYYVEVPAPV